MNKNDKGQWRMDPIDRIILSKLLDDSCRTERQILMDINTSAFNVSGSLFRLRLSKMKKEGIVGKAQVYINPKDIGYDHTATILVKLMSDEDSKVFEDTAKVLTRIRTCKMLKGEYDYIIETVCKDKQDFAEFMRYLYNTDLILKIQTLETTDLVFKKSYVPLD